MNREFISGAFLNLLKAAKHPIAAALLTAAILAWTPPVGARVTRIVIDKNKSESPAYAGKSFGQVGQCEKIVGEIYGELDPKDPHNKIIQDIELAPRNSHGMVEYVASFSLTKPIDMSKASGVLIYEVVNRGSELIPSGFKRGNQSGDDFLLARGVVILRSGWQGDLRDDIKGNWGGKLFRIQVPVAKNPDGSSITGPVMARFADMPPNTNTLPLTAAMPSTARSSTQQHPTTLDTAEASLTAHASETMSGVIQGEKTISSTDWAWADCTKVPFPGEPDATKICLKNGFDPKLLYQLVFQAKDPAVMGIGLAAIRDAVSFFRYAEKDSAGTLNPVAKRVSHVVSYGASQSGQVTRTFIHLGFNQDETGRIVWDGSDSHIAGRQIPINFRFAAPGGATSVYEPTSEGVLWWSDWPDTVRQRKTAGLLDRCSATKSCPKIFDTLGAGEFWNLKMSADLVGTSADKDIPLPDNVRRYYLPTTRHGGGDGGFNPAPEYNATSFTSTACVLANNPNPQHETMRALMLALIDWVVKGTPPPPSRYPKLADKELVLPTKAAMEFPTIPGTPPPDGLVNPLLDYDFGPNFNYNDMSGLITKLPPTIKHVIPSLVPKVNADGNETAGVPSVLLQAPLGTYTGWNVSGSGFFKGQACGLSGGYIPFAKTKAERMASGDPRLSLEERYPNREAYVAKVRVAAEKAVRERFLLQEDADWLIQQAASNFLPNR